MPGFILIRPTVWPRHVQCTNVTNRQTDRTGQTDRQRTDSIGRSVLQTVAQKQQENKLVSGDTAKTSRTQYVKFTIDNLITNDNLTALLLA